MRSTQLFALTRLRSLPRGLSVWLTGLLLATLLGWSLAQSGLDRTQALALQRYGSSGAATVSSWRQMLEEARNLPDDGKLKAVNTFFNRKLRYTSDQATWGVLEYWATPLEFMGRAEGDCEDFAIAKYISLLILGVPSEKLRLIYVRARFGGASSTNSEAHMVMGYYADPTGEPLILDNLVATIRPAATRTDLSPVFSFNTQGVWVPGAQRPASSDPTTRLSRWRDVLERIRSEGITI